MQRELFPDLSEDELRIVELLGRVPEGLQINVLVVEADIPVNRMSALLFELEMKGVIRLGRRGVPADRLNRMKTRKVRQKPEDKAIRF